MRRSKEALELFDLPSYSMSGSLSVLNKEKKERGSLPVREAATLPGKFVPHNALDHLCKCCPSQKMRGISFFPVIKSPTSGNDFQTFHRYKILMSLYFLLTKRWEIILQHRIRVHMLELTWKQNWLQCSPWDPKGFPTICSEGQNIWKEKTSVWNLRSWSRANWNQDTTL